MATQHWLEFYKIQKASLEFQVKKVSQRIEELEGKLAESHPPSEEPKNKKKRKKEAAESDGTTEPEKTKSKSTADGEGAEDDSTHKLGRWSKEETKKLQEAVQKFGQQNLEAITQHIGTRTLKSVKSKLEQPEHDGEDKPKKKKKKAEENQHVEGGDKEEQRKKQEEEEKRKKQEEEEEEERRRQEEEEAERKRQEEEEKRKREEEERKKQEEEDKRKKQEEEDKRRKEDEHKKKKKKPEDDEERKTRKKSKHVSGTPSKMNHNADADEEISFKSQFATPMVDTFADAHTPISEESKKSSSKKTRSKPTTDSSTPLSLRSPATGLTPKIKHKVVFERVC